VSPIAAAAVAPFVDARVIPNGIDAAGFSGDTAREAHRVVFLGRDEPRKGLDVLLAAWDAVRRAVPEAELHVMGSERPDAGSGITFLGRVPDALKRQELTSAAVFCAPNTGGESFGIVIAEAMAAGCAVVASDLESFAYVLGEAGMLVPVNDADALADTLVTLLTSPGLVADLSGRGLRRVQNYDRTKVLEAYVEAYREAIQADG
jgi:phosphatidylinositol alpha-mannosyltransferase